MVLKGKFSHIHTNGSQKKYWAFLKTLSYIKVKNLNYDYERFIYLEKTENEINKYLNNLYKAVVKVVDWAKSTRIEKIADQMKERGESAWVEKLWLTAYSNQKNI